MLKQGFLPLWMNCFTISYLLGSGNLSSMSFRSHKNSSRGGLVQKSLCGETVAPTQPLCICYSFSVKPCLTSSPAPSSPAPCFQLCERSMASGWPQPSTTSAPGGEVRRPGCRGCSSGQGRGGKGCSLGPDRELIFFLIRCVMLKRQGNGQNQNK